jgi:hypothetical protein
MSATLAAGIGAAALPPDIDPMSPAAIDIVSDIEESLRQLKRQRAPVAA